MCDGKRIEDVGLFDVRQGEVIQTHTVSVSRLFLSLSHLAAGQNGSCVCVCVCVHVYVVYEDTNLYNDMGMT